MLGMSETTCAKCDKYYVNPRMLPCLHSFCLGCLEKELETQETQNSLHCPSCKEEVTLPGSGVSDLPQDLHKSNEAEITRISEKVDDADEQCEMCGRTDSTGKAVAYCIECKEYLCKFCEGRHGRREMTADHNLVTIGQRFVKTNETSSIRKFLQPKMLCVHHRSHVLEAYCKKCEKLICMVCMNFEHDDHRGQCKYLEQVAKEERESLLTCQREAKVAVASLDGAIARCKETVEKVKTRKNEVNVAISNSLEQVRKALLAQSEEICSSKIAGLKVQVCQLQRVRDGLSLASSAIEKAQSHSPAQLLSIKKVLAERATVLHEEFKESDLLLSRNAAFVADISEPAIISKMIGLASVLGGNGHPEFSTTDAGYSPLAIVGVPRTIKVVAGDKHGQRLGEGGDEVEGKLIQTGFQGPAITGKTTDHGDGTYSLSFTPQVVGERELHVTISNGHVKGSPFKYHVTNPRAVPYTALSTAHSTFGTYAQPYDVAVTEEGNLAVAEYGYHTVSLYSVTGQRIYTFGTAGKCGSGDGQFYSPSAVAIRGDLMYVCEDNNSRVQKFSISKRAFISKLGSSGHGEGCFSKPRGICFDPLGKVFIAEHGNHRIQVFNEDYSFAYSFSCPLNPWGLAFDLQGNLLHVAAYGSSCIKVFTPEGTEITSYGSGTISAPAGIAIDAQGYIAISEYGGSARLWIYSPNRTLVHTLSNQLGICLGISCDKDGFFWVANYGNNRIAKY